MAVGVDEARDDDPVAGVDHRGGIVGERDVRPHLPDLAVLDQHIGAREVADLPVDRQHQAALDENAPRPLQAGKLGIRRRRGGALRQRRARQGRGTGRQHPGARLQKAAPRGFGVRGGGWPEAIRRAAVVGVIAHRNSPSWQRAAIP